MGSPNHNLDLIRAAGGLVWRDSPQGWLLAVVHRTEHKDWTLPKGKLKENEEWQNAARREVEEETGCRVRVVDFAGSISYIANGKPKIVRFWHMSVVGTPGTPLGEDVDNVAWLSLEEASKCIHYPLEKALLENTRPPDAPSDSRLWRWWQSLWESNSYHRLARSLPPYRIELEHLIANRHHIQEVSGGELDSSDRTALPAGSGTDRISSSKTDQAPSKSEDFSDWSGAALCLLDRSAKALRDNDAELGWRCFKAATRLELCGLSREAFQAKAQTLLREAQEKLSSWRKDAIINLLSEDGNFNENVAVDKVVCAAQIMHEHQDNVYQRLRIFKQQLLILSIVAVLAITFWIIWGQAPGTVALASLPSLDEMLPAPSLAVVFFGILGAAVSGILSTVSNPAKARIPDQLTGMSITLARLVIGAAAALAASVFLLSGILNLGAQLSPALVLAAAFASGFSERLVTRAIETVAK